jgi:hypothetical protein
MPFETFQSWYVLTSVVSNTNMASTRTCKVGTTLGHSVCNTIEFGIDSDRFWCDQCLKSTLIFGLMVLTVNHCNLTREIYMAKETSYQYSIE